MAVERHVWNGIKRHSHAKHICYFSNIDIKYEKTYLLRNFMKNFLRYCKAFHIIKFYIYVFLLKDAILLSIREILEVL